MNVPSRMRLLTAGLITAALAGCSDSDSSSGSSSTATESFSGKVADGYLAGARVCLDLNDNQTCDDGEPSTVSSSGGAFTIEGATAEQLASAALVVVLPTPPLPDVTTTIFVTISSPRFCCRVWLI